MKILTDHSLKIKRKRKKQKKTAKLRKMKKGRGKKRAKEREFVHCNSLKTKRPCVVYSLTQRKLASSVSPSSPVSLIPVTPHHFRFLMPPLAPSHNHLPKPCYHCLGIRPLQSVHKLAPTFTFAPL